MDKLTGSCKGSNLQGGIVWSGLNYLFIVNLFIYVCANDLAAAGAKAPLKRPGFFRSGPRMLGHLTHSSLKAISTDFLSKEIEEEQPSVCAALPGWSRPEDPRASASFKILGKAPYSLKSNQLANECLCQYVRNPRFV